MQNLAHIKSLDADAVVVGGGLAGSAAAQLLARQGKQVILLEKSREAHHKVCGEFLSIEAQHYLSGLGIDLPSLGAVPIRRFRLNTPETSIEAPLPFTALSLSRFVLDEQLLLSAKQAGVTVRRGQRAAGFTPTEAGNWQVRLEATTAETLTSPLLFLATGKHDMPGVAPRVGMDNTLIGFKLYFRLSPAQQAALNETVEVFTFRDGVYGYAGLQPVEDNRANLCLVVEKTAFQACGKHWPVLLNQLMAQNRLLAQRLESATPCWENPLAIYGIPYGFVFEPPKTTINGNGLGSGFYRLGDQMAVIPSFCGEGMSMALHSAFVAAHFARQQDAFAYYRYVKQRYKTQVKTASVLIQTQRNHWLKAGLLYVFAQQPTLLSWLASKTRIPDAELIHV